MYDMILYHRRLVQNGELMSIIVPMCILQMESTHSRVLLFERKIHVLAKYADLVSCLVSYTQMKQLSCSNVANQISALRYDVTLAAHMTTSPECGMQAERGELYIP